MQINNLSLKIATHQDRIGAAIQRVVASGWLVLGPEVRQFEQSFAQYLGAGHCVSVANGTDAIELALKAMGVSVEDRVATVANAGMYATTAMLAIGAKPYFMDVDAETGSATLEQVKTAVGVGVKAVIVTHLYGLAVPAIREIADFCASKGVMLLEDCAQAHGAKVGGRHVGTFGDAASFSFYPTKNLGALGDGGAVVTGSPTIAEKVGLLRQYGWTAKYRVELAGARNSRLDEMQAAILNEFLPYLDGANSRRREIADRYSSLIRHPDVVVPRQAGQAYVAHLYVVRSARRDALREHLHVENIATDVHYPIPDYRQPVFADRFSDLYLKNTEVQVSQILTLPCYPEMTDEEVDMVITAVNGWL